MKKLAVLTLAFAFLAACNNAGDNKAATYDTLTEENVAPEGRQLQNTFTGLFTYLHQQDTSFTVDSFYSTGTYQIDALPAMAFEKKQLQPFLPFLIYNADSSQAIDIYSYNYVIIGRKGNRKMAEAGPDTEIAVINTKDSTRKRIFFFGPSHTVWNAKWMNETKIAIAGAEIQRNKRYKPIIWLVSLPDSSAKVFTYSGQVSATMNRYKKEVLHGGGKEF